MLEAMKLINVLSSLKLRKITRVRKLKFFVTAMLQSSMF